MKPSISCVTGFCFGGDTNSQKGQSVMKILTILNDDNDQALPEFLQELQAQNQVEVVSLAEQQLSYEELVEKIDQCDKVISW
jgi:hypothetical protein